MAAALFPWGFCKSAALLSFFLKLQLLAAPRLCCTTSQYDLWCAWEEAELKYVVNSLAMDPLNTGRPRDLVVYVVPEAVC